MDKQTDIPKEHKCSRCKLDLREEAKEKERCTCIKEHPTAANKSGGMFMKTVIDYKGIK